jgi:hypothetical protein
MFIGLFSKIILMGGNANTDWALSTTERVLSASSRIAENSGWNESDYY